MFIGCIYTWLFYYGKVMLDSDPITLNMHVNATILIRESPPENFQDNK